MRVAAMVIGILGSILMLGVSIFSYLLAYPGSVAQLGAMATGAIGLLCLLGSGLAMGHPRAGGAILLLCGVPLLLMSFTALNLLIVAPVIIAGVLAVMGGREAASGGTGREDKPRRAGVDGIQ